MNKRIVCLLAAVLMLLTGCGQGGTEGSSSAPGKESGITTTAGTTTATAGGDTTTAGESTTTGLNSYPVLLLSGDVKLSSAEAKRYVAYVQQGGTLICNTAYLKFFDAYASAYKGGARQDIKDGKGTVIVYGPDYSTANLAGILSEQVAKYIPFTFSEQVQYLVNVKDGSLIVTVINNDGAEKVWDQQPTFDASKAMDLTVTYTGDLKIKQVKELFYGEKVTRSGNGVKTYIGPGDYRVFEFVFD